MKFPGFSDDRLTSINDPVERVIAEALVATDLVWVHEAENGDETKWLDFVVVLPEERRLYIECARGYTPRKIKQLGRVSQVIYVQDLSAAKVVAAGLRQLYGKRGWLRGFRECVS